MVAHNSRKVLLAAMLATALSAPALANDTVTTAQLTAVGQGTTELASVQDSPVVVKEVLCDGEQRAHGSAARARQGGGTAPYRVGCAPAERRRVL